MPAVRTMSAGPEWVASQRRDAMDRYRALDYPTGREEIWRYTDVRAIHPDGYTPASGEPVSFDAPEGVTVCNLDDALVTHADVLRPRLGSLVGPDDPFTALSLAMHAGGTFVHVQRGVHATLPIHARHRVTASGASLFPRTVVVVEEDARVVFNDVYSSEKLDAPTLFVPVTEVFAGPHAHVGWVTWQDHGPGVRHLSTIKAHLDEGAVLDSLVVTLGGDFSRTWKECVLAGTGARSTMLGLYLPHGEQRFEHWTLQDHAAPKTTSDLLYKGALLDASQSVYYGTIKVRAGARGTDAYQANRNLTLSPKAKALTNPQLEIANNEVRCTHGATVGRVDEEHVYYLMSRGIPRPEAERLLVFGFFNQVLDRVAWSGMQEELKEAIAGKVTRT